MYIKHKAWEIWIHKCFFNCKKKLRNYLKIVSEPVLTIFFNLFMTFTFSSITYLSSVILLLPLYKKYVIAIYTAIVLLLGTTDISIQWNKADDV
jgi:hypothetical protein